MQLNKKQIRKKIGKIKKKTDNGWNIDRRK
jgi:hypothetical protein